MTTYTAIADADIDTDSPITESLMTKIRDNPIAITEGASGAPLIQNAALATDSVQAAQIQANAVGSSEIAAAAVTFASEISTPSDDVNLTSTTGGTAIPAGIYNLGRSTTSCHLEIYCGSTQGWQPLAGVSTPVTDFDQQIASDGTSVRLRAQSTGGTVQARRIAV